MTSTPLHIALVGIGKIAQDQHIPALRKDSSLVLVAAASHHGEVEGIANFSDLQTLLAEMPEIDAVSLCTPPQSRYALAAAAIAAGKHVMLEKPPGTTVAEVIDLKARAEAKGVSLFAAWHSREAAAVAAAKAWLVDRNIHSARITWKEDVRVWHPGQDWIWQPGGLGVFDPGINALSILTAILPHHAEGGTRLTGARLVFPSNRATPIAADLEMVHGSDTPITAVFDFRQEGPQYWTIEVQTDAGNIHIADGGAALAINDVAVPLGHVAGEYPGLYAQFGALIRKGSSDVDVLPLQLVADAFLIGAREETSAFHD